jgi:hypothetical protein
MEIELNAENSDQVRVYAERIAEVLISGISTDS